MWPTISVLKPPTSSRKLLPAAGFDLVYDKSYPLGTQGSSPVIRAAKAANTNAFIAYSYHPIPSVTDQAKIENLDVKVYYNGIGCAFAGFAGKYGSAAENVIRFGGVPDNEKTRAFLRLHKEVTGVDFRLQRLFYVYANGEVLTQAFEGAGTVDREAVTAYLKPYVQDLDRRNRSSHSAAKHRLYSRPMAERLLPLSSSRGRLRILKSCPSGSRPAGHEWALRQSWCKDGKSLAGKTPGNVCPRPFSAGDNCYVPLRNDFIITNAGTSRECWSSRCRLPAGRPATRV